MTDRIPETIYDPNRERWITGYVDSAGIVVEVIAAKPSRDSQAMRSGADRNRNKRTQIVAKIERMEAVADSINTHSLVVECMTENSRKLIEGRAEHRENLSNTNEKAYRLAAKVAEFEKRVAALVAARRKSPNEIMIEAIRDAGAIKVGINN